MPTLALSTHSEQESDVIIRKWVEYCSCKDVVRKYFNTFINKPKVCQSRF